MRNKRCTIRTRLVPGSAVCLLTAASTAAAIPQDYIVIDLGPLAGWSASDARALNEANQVIGYSADNASVTVLEPGATGRATLWHDANGNDEIDPGEMIDLGSLISPTSCWHLAQAWAINNSSWIVGFGTNRDGDAHGYLLKSGFVCPWDLDGDEEVGILDLLALLTAWGPCPDPPESCFADFDCDGSVGILDLLALLANWGDCIDPGSEAPPQTVQDCLDRYLNNPEKLEACLLMLQLQTQN